jgi:hypothetical protein
MEPQKRFLRTVAFLFLFIYLFTYCFHLFDFSPPPSPLVLDPVKMVTHTLVCEEMTAVCACVS